MWDGIPGHTFRLPPYRFSDCYGNDDESPEYAFPDMAIDFRRIPVKGALRDGTQDKYEQTYRNYEVKPVFSRDDKGKVTGPGEQKIEGDINYVAVADEVDPWGPPGGGPGRDYTAERHKDYDGRYQYFIVNNDPYNRSLIVNGTTIPRGFVAGPLPTFATIECDGNIGFWHGYGGTFYNLDLTKDDQDRIAKDWGVDDSDDSDDDWRGDHRGGPKKQKKKRHIGERYSRLPYYDPQTGRPALPPPGWLPPPPKFSLTLPTRPKDHDRDKKTRGPGMPVSTGRPIEKPRRMKDPNDVFGDDTAAPDWSNLPPVGNGPRRPVVPPLPEPVPIVEDEFVNAPMHAITAFVESNKKKREDGFEKANEEEEDERKKLVEEEEVEEEEEEEEEEKAPAGLGKVDSNTSKLSTGSGKPNIRVPVTTPLTRLKKFTKACTDSWTEFKLPVFSSPFGSAPDASNKLAGMKSPSKRVRDRRRDSESDESPTKRVKAARDKAKAEREAKERGDPSS